MKIILSLLWVFLLFGCDYKQPSVQSEQEGSSAVKVLKKSDAFTRVIGEGVLKVGYISYPPSFIIDPNSGKFSGISNDILQEVASKLGLKVSYESEVSWGDMIEAIKSGKVDIIATAVWPTAARGKHTDFTSPLFKSVVHAYVRYDDIRFDGNLKIANSPEITIASMDGEMSLIIAESDFPKAKNSSLSQSNSVSELALMVSSSKADITFLEPAIAEGFMAKNPKTLKKVANVYPLRIFPNVYMIGKGEYNLKSTLDAAIGELHSSRFIDRTIEKYEKYPDSFVRIK